MLKKIVKALVKKLGYEIKKARPGFHTEDGFEIYRYTRADGTFDYEKYKEIQEEGNKRKIEAVWVIEENIEFLADYIKKTVDPVAFGICHGTRRGKEQEWFRKHLGCEVIGTEISDTAEQFPHTIQWDFHETKPEWIDAVDFIYSNSFDHSYDPEKCLNAWMGCVRRGGICILEHTSGHERVTPLDPFGAHISRLPYLILTWGQGTYSVREIISPPTTSEKYHYIHYVIVQRL